MKKKRWLRFNDKARIPFSVIGVFLILGSSVTTVYIIRLEVQKSSELAQSMDIDELTVLLREVEADITTAMNIAGMKALKEIGKEPLINTQEIGAEQMNQYRAKGIIREEMNIYLSGHYLENMFNNGRYGINVVLHNNSPILSIENISITPVDMRLTRTTIPFIGPVDHVDHPTYWTAMVPLDIEIQKMEGTQPAVVMRKTIQVSTLITSRYPLLESLVNEYQKTINGTFSPLWIVTTGISNIYSLIRGYKHFSSGQPSNIVDNKHLACIVNGGLLLEQSLVFNSVDPLALVDLALQTKKTLKQPSGDGLQIFNKEMVGDGYDMSTRDISAGSANVDAGDDLNQSVDNCPHVNLSDIAERILYNITSVTVRFENEDGETVEELIVFDDEFNHHIQERIQFWMNHSYHLTDVHKDLEINITTQQVLQTIITSIYQDEIYTKVVERYVAAELPGDPGTGWTSGGSSAWISLELTPLAKQVVKPAKGHVVSGSALFEELYNVTYQRTHFWWKMEWQNISGNHTLVKHWNNVSDMLIETVTLQVLLSQYACYNDTKNDVVDILYYNETIDDLNLEDTLDSYLIMYPDTHEGKQTLITTQGNTGTIDLQTTIPGTVYEWVENEAWESINELFQAIATITLNSSINATNYPNPLLLLEMTKQDLETKYLENLPNYRNISRYQTGSEFQSVGKKAVYCSREWYVERVQKDLVDTFSQVTEQAHNIFEQEISPDAEFSSHDITDVLDTTADAIRNQFTIPFGFDITLIRFDAEENELWNETVRLAVDQYPNFLNPNEKTRFGEEEFWTLKLRNRCLLGPTGFPILPPTPVTPWVATINVWCIDVEGEYAQLKVIDTSDETLFNPILGHEPQVYVREANIITAGDVILGENTRLKFGFSTVAFGLVPAWGMMIGDVQENWFDDHTPGFDEE